MSKAKKTQLPIGTKVIHSKDVADPIFLKKSLSLIGLQSAIDLAICTDQPVVFKYAPLSVKEVTNHADVDRRDCVFFYGVDSDPEKNALLPEGGIGSDRLCIYSPKYHKHING